MQNGGDARSKVVSRKSKAFAHLHGLILFHPFLAANERVFSIRLTNKDKRVCFAFAKGNQMHFHVTPYFRQSSERGELVVIILLMTGLVLADK